jgi:hypothetical protein
MTLSGPVCALRPCRRPAARSVAVGNVRGHIVRIRVCGDRCEAVARARAAELLDAIERSLAPGWVGAPPRRLS